jgi:hypothetical protein
MRILVHWWHSVTVREKKKKIIIQNVGWHGKWATCDQREVCTSGPSSLSVETMLVHSVNWAGLGVPAAA